MTESDLDILFSPFGTLQSLELLRPEGGITTFNKGRAFIYFSTPLEATTACQAVHGLKTLKGKILHA